MRQIVPFLQFWYDSNWDWTPVSQTIDEQFLCDGKGEKLNQFFKWNKVCLI